MFIVILDHENMGRDTIIMTLPLLLAKIFPKIEFLVMDALIYICKLNIQLRTLYMFIVILDHGNMGVDTMFETLLFITKKLLIKIRNTYFCPRLS